MTPLIYAAFLGHTEQFRFACKNHSEIFIRNLLDSDRDGMTCLHWAASKCHNDIIAIISQNEPRALLKTILQRDSLSLTPLHYAIKAGNTDFIFRKSRYPQKYDEFMQAREGKLFAQMCAPNEDNTNCLLYGLVMKGKTEVLKIFAEKEPDTFFNYMLVPDCKGLTPFQYIGVNNKINIISTLHTSARQLLKKMIDIKFINWLFPDCIDFAHQLLPYIDDPILHSILSINVIIYQNNDKSSFDAIKTELARHPPQEFIPALLESNVIRSYLCWKDGILFEDIQEIPSLNFLTIQNRIDLVLHMSPSRILETFGHVTNDQCRDYLDSTIYVDSENYTIKEILEYAHAQFADHLDQENAFNSVHDYLFKIKPKQLFCVMRKRYIRKILLDFLSAMPDPHYRVIIPLLTCEEFLAFMDTLHLGQQARYCLVATAEQKKAYVDNLPDLVSTTMDAWIKKVEEMCAQLEEKLNEKVRDVALLKKHFLRLKELWSTGQEQIIAMGQNALVYNQLNDRLISQELFTPFRASCRHEN